MQAKDFLGQRFHRFKTSASANGEMARKALSSRQQLANINKFKYTKRFRKFEMAQSRKTKPFEESALKQVRDSPQPLCM